MLNIRNKIVFNVDQENEKSSLKYILKIFIIRGNMIVNSLDDWQHVNDLTELSQILLTRRAALKTI